MPYQGYWYRRGYYNRDTQWFPKSHKLGVTWLDDTTFKVDCVGQGLTDAGMKEWCDKMDASLEKYFGADSPSLLATDVNFSRNSISDDGIVDLTKFLLHRKIGVEKIKLYSNWIGDVGAEALGVFLANSVQTVHELHLSHNSISTHGVFALLSPFAKSRRYPCFVSSTGLSTPLWLRIEKNELDWRVVEGWMKGQRLTWTLSWLRDDWEPRHAPPMIALHHSVSTPGEASYAGEAYYAEEAGHAEEASEAEEDQRNSDEHVAASEREGNEVSSSANSHPTSGPSLLKTLLPNLQTDDDKKSEEASGQHESLVDSDAKTPSYIPFARPSSGSPLDAAEAVSAGRSLPTVEKAVGDTRGPARWGRNKCATASDPQKAKKGSNKMASGGNQNLSEFYTVYQ